MGEAKPCAHCEQLHVPIPELRTLDGRPVCLLCTVRRVALLLRVAGFPGEAKW